jgi:hypothetical protein
VTRRLVIAGLMVSAFRDTSIVDGVVVLFDDGGRRIDVQYSDGRRLK